MCRYDEYAQVCKRAAQKGAAKALQDFEHHGLNLFDCNNDRCDVDPLQAPVERVRIIALDDHDAAEHQGGAQPDLEAELDPPAQQSPNA